MHSPTAEKSIVCSHILGPILHTYYDPANTARRKTYVERKRKSSCPDGKQFGPAIRTFIVYYESQQRNRQKNSLTHLSIPRSIVQVDPNTVHKDTIDICIAVHVISSNVRPFQSLMIITQTFSSN